VSRNWPEPEGLVLFELRPRAPAYWPAPPHEAAGLQRDRRQAGPGSSDDRGVLSGREDPSLRHAVPIPYVKQAD